MIGAGQARVRTRWRRSSATFAATRMRWTRRPASSCGKCGSIPIRSRASPQASTVHEGRVYVALASLEEPESASFNYICCTVRGMVAVLDASTGKQIWKTYTIPEEPSERKTDKGVKFLGPSGAGIWGPITIDPKRQAVYVSTGNAFSAPDLGRANAVMAHGHQHRESSVGHAGDARRRVAHRMPAGTIVRRTSAAERASPPGPAAATREGDQHAAGRPTTTVRMKQRIPIGISPPARSWSTSQVAGRWSWLARNPAASGLWIPTTKARWCGTRISAEGRFFSAARRTKSRRTSG